MECSDVEFIVHLCVPVSEAGVPVSEAGVPVFLRVWAVVVLQNQNRNMSQHLCMDCDTYHYSSSKVII